MWSKAAIKLSRKKEQMQGIFQRTGKKIPVAPTWHDREEPIRVEAIAKNYRCRVS